MGGETENHIDLGHAEMIAEEAARKAVKAMMPEVRTITYDVGRKLQQESHVQFQAVFQSVLNVDPTNPSSVKELQRILLYAEDRMVNDAADRRALRTGFITACFGWVATLALIAWNWARSATGH